MIPKVAGEDGVESERGIVAFYNFVTYGWFFEHRMHH